MMFCVHILIVLTLIVIQTTFIPYHELFQSFYDLPLVFVIYLGLYRPMREGIPMIIFLGCIMDSLSGSPLGIYTTSYVWIYGGCFWFLTFLHAHNHLFLIVIVVISVVVENIIFIIGLMLQVENPDLSNTLFNMIFIQVFWAIFTGPWLIVLFNYSQSQTIEWYNFLRDKQNGLH